MKTDVIVVGAGPVGLTSALLLAEAGVHVTVLEAAAELPSDMRASTFHAATLDIIDTLGLAQPLIAEGTPVSRWQYWIHGTGQHAVFDMDLIADVTAYPFRLQCEQFRYARHAVKRLEQLSDARVVFDARVTALDADDGGYTLRTEDGRGSRAQWHAPWVIAADGGRSAIRKLLALEFPGSVFPKTSVTAVVDFPMGEHLPGLLGVNYVWTETAHYSLMQLRDTWRFSFSPEPGCSAEQATDRPYVQSRLQQLLPQISGKHILHASHYTLHQRCLDSFVHGGVLFAGDSAHLNSPAGGMGMNSGIHDARCLVEHLLQVMGGADPGETLARYSRKRRTIAIDEVQRRSARNYAWHRETDPEKRKKIWQEIADTADNPQKAREFLLGASMLSSLWREREIE